MSIIIPANTLAAAGGFSVDNSCRFNSGDSAYMTKEMDTPTDADKYTFSFWVKRSKLAAQQSIFRSTNGNAANDSHVTFQADDTLRFEEYGGSASVGKLQTDQKFRDTNAWYHIVLVYDSGNGTAGNRMRMYVNGTEVTSFGTDNNPSQNADSFFNKDGEVLSLGRTQYSGGGNYFSGYLAEVVMCDGQALAADSFGEFDEDSGIWKPIDVSGLTFGTNGFYLDFEASGNLGNDVNGGTDFGESGLAAADQSLDTCTNNQCVLNGILLPNSQPATFSQGNTAIVQNGNWRSYAGTFGLTSGKWYFEADGSGTAGTVLYGIASLEAINLQDKTASNLNYTIGLNQPAYAYHGSSGGMYHSTSSSNAQGQGGGSWGAAFNSSNLISVYIDLDNNKLYTAKDNTMNVSGTGYDIEAGFTYFPVVVAYGVTTALNFGNGEFNGTAVSSAVADANGFGAFEYDPSRGGGSDFDGAAKDFLCINSKNLSTVNS